MLILAISTVGCGSTKPAGGPPSEDRGNASKPATDQGVSETGASGQNPIKIGAILPYSGVYAALGESLTRGMELYFDSINWEVAGRKIELIKEDEENDPQVALRKLRKLVGQDRIDVLTGPVNTAVAYALRDEVDQQGIPFLVSHAGGNDLTRSKRSEYIWRSSFNSWQIGYSMGKHAYEVIGKKMFVIAPDYAFGREVTTAFKQAFTQAGGQIVGELYPPLGANDYASYLTQIKSAKPDAVYAFFAGSDAVRFVKQYDEYGLKGKIPLIGSGWLVAENVRPAMGTSAEGIISTMFWDYSLGTLENQAFVKAYEEKYKERPSLEAVEGYDAARVIVEAFKKLNGDTSDKKKIAEAIGQVEFISPRGPIKFDPETHHIIQQMYLIKTVLKDGKTENMVMGTLGEFKDPGQ
ncbi:MAG: ABC transporter substrate-binding protein [Hydrogenibacillus schlegelii]|uniref:ABC transporter substrate-binding protein n=1 Tax=Hydrogenibacillus schlegelii TaxID=1484 RepID=A0A947G7T5_HYDSH|nr:ABC transporter substrate-binding protein [Hydrogenibacillus schlegelii]